MNQLRSIRNCFRMDFSASSREDSRKTRKKKRKKYSKISGVEKEEDFTPLQDHDNDGSEKEAEKREPTVVFGDLNCLIPPRKNRSFKKGNNAPANSRRKVQWNDENGKKLVHVREFVPSDSSDDDYDDDGFDSCVCVLM